MQRHEVQVIEQQEGLTLVACRGCQDQPFQVRRPSGKHPKNGPPFFILGFWAELHEAVAARDAYLRWEHQKYRYSEGKVG